ncbi:MAG: hypothetical protein WHT46_08900 [Candidatus Geothermincolales bacterium]
MSDECRACGLPRELKKRVFWTSQGEMFSRQARGERLIFLDVNWTRYLVEEALNQGGKDLLHLLKECRREHTRKRVEATVRGWGAFLMRRRLTGRQLFDGFLEELPHYGFGRFEILEFKPRKLARLKVDDAYDDLFLVADLLGLWEATQGVRASEILEPAGKGSFSLLLKAEEKVKRVESGREDEGKRSPTPLKKDDVIPLCPRCRRPRYPGRMVWNVKGGTIYDELSGRRFIISTVSSWARVFFLLKRECPPAYHAFARRLGEASRESFVSPVEDGGAKDIKAAYRDFFLSLPFLGWGRPIRVRRRPFLVEAELVGTPFPDLLAAEMRGRFGSLEREEWSVEVKASRDGGHLFVMGPSVDGIWIPLEKTLPPRSHPGIILPW